MSTDNQFAAGDVITLQIAGTASHYGGHCSFWYSVDDIHFTKIADVRDCTLNADTTQVQIPDTLPVQCGTKCTFAWSWVPRVSGQCEVYSNCADISVSGLSGNTEANPQTINFQDIIDEQLCQRVEYVYVSMFQFPIIFYFITNFSNLANLPNHLQTL